MQWQALSPLARAPWRQPAQDMSRMHTTQPHLETDQVSVTDGARLGEALSTCSCNAAGAAAPRSLSRLSNRGTVLNNTMSRLARNLCCAAGSHEARQQCHAGIFDPHTTHSGYFGENKRHAVIRHLKLCPGFKAFVATKGQRCSKWLDLYHEQKLHKVCLRRPKKLRLGCHVHRSGGKVPVHGVQVRA